MSELMINNVILFDQQEVTAAHLAQQVQATLNAAWEYKRKDAPEIVDLIEERIANYKASDLISHVDNFDMRCKIDRRRFSASYLGDFVEIYNGEYRPMSSVSKSRNGGFSYNWYYRIVFIYYPASNTIDCYFYSHN